MGLVADTGLSAALLSEKVSEDDTAVVGFRSIPADQLQVMA
jgi:hypothetical protein